MLTSWLTVCRTSRRSDLIDEWVAGYPAARRAVARRAAAILGDDDVAGELNRVAGESSRAANSRRRDVLAVKQLARELALHDLLSAATLVAILDVQASPERRAPATVEDAADVDELLAAAARIAAPLRASLAAAAAAAVVLVAGARLTARQAVSLRWADIDLSAGQTPHGVIPAALLDHLCEHQAARRR